MGTELLGAGRADDCVSELGADRVDGVLDEVARLLVDGREDVAPRSGNDERGAGSADDGVRVLGAAREAPDLPPGAAPRLASPRLEGTAALVEGTLLRGAGRADPCVRVDGAARADGLLGPSRPGELREPALLPLLGVATLPAVDLPPGLTRSDGRLDGAAADAPLDPVLGEATEEPLPVRGEATGELRPSRGEATEPGRLRPVEARAAVRFGPGAEATTSEAPRGVALRRVAVRPTVPRGLSL